MGHNARAKRVSGRGVAALLRASRLRCGEDIQDVAEVLCISRRYIEAIEEGRFEDLPGATYAVGFIRAYAEHLGLDSDEVVRRFKLESSDINGRPDLRFPVPIPESGIPGGAVVFVGVVVAVLAYSGWYLSTAKDGIFTASVGPVSTGVEMVTEAGGGMAQSRSPERARGVSGPVWSVQTSPGSATAATTSKDPLAEGMSASQGADDGGTQPVDGPVDARITSPDPTPPVGALRKRNVSLATSPITRPSEETSRATSIAATPPSGVDDDTDGSTDGAARTGTEEATVLVSVVMSPPSTETVSGGDEAATDLGIAAGAMEAGAMEAGAMEAGAMEAGAMEAGAMEAGAMEAGAMEAGAMEAGAMEAGAMEAGAMEAGAMEAGVTLTGTTLSAPPEPPAVPDDEDLQAAIPRLIDTLPLDEADTASPPRAAAGAVPTTAEVSPERPEPTTSAAPAAIGAGESEIASLPEGGVGLSPGEAGAYALDPRQEARHPTIVVRARMNSWIQIRDDIGKQLLLTRLLRAGESYVVPNRLGLRLLTGNAGALEIAVDGDVVPSIGPVGKVRRGVVLEAGRLRRGTAVIE